MELSAARLDGFCLATYADPTPRPQQVVVGLCGASLNFLDIAIATGKYPLDRFPIIPVTDGAGVIEAVGSAVTEWKVGDRVIPHFLPDWRAPADCSGPEIATLMGASAVSAIVGRATARPIEEKAAIRKTLRREDEAFLFR